MLKNGSFTEGWTDVQAPYGYLVNQEPTGWKLRWLDKGESLFGAGDTATGVPECVHKLARQLPANEQLGAANALILAGNTTYKIFNSGAAFGAELSQTVTGLEPGSTAELVVPVQVHLHGETDAYGAESGVWVNGEGQWVNGGEMGDRKWYKHTYQLTVPDSGTLEIVIRVKSKWPRPKDFFIDGITLDAAAGSGTTTPDTTTTNVVKVSLPAGFQLVTAISPQSNIVTLSVPEGTEVEVM